MIDQIKYRAGYKYQLAEDYKIQTGIIGYSVETDYIKLHLSGMLVIKSGYAWDGASGPALDTKDIMRGSLVHDALYELMRKGFLPTSERKVVDKEFERICLQDGMSEFRVRYVCDAVRAFGSKHANPENKKEVFTAP